MILSQLTAPGTGGRTWVGLVSLGCRLLLAGVWLYAGLAKIGDLDGSIRAVKAYRILPTTLAELVGAALPFLEVGLGLLLLVGLATRLSAALSALLMAAFSAGIIAAWARGLQIDCGCFGGGGDLPPGETASYLPTLARDLGFLAASGFLLWFPRTPWSLDRYLRGD